MSESHACLSYERLEQLLGIADLPDDARLHLDSCASCRRHLDILRQNNSIWELVWTHGSRAAADGGSRDSTTANPLPASIPGYELRDEIHRGGQGIVYRAYHPATKRTVAVKLLLHGAFATPQQRIRFEREVELVAGLHHPNIVTVFDSGITPDGRPYLVMQHIDGQPLHEYRQRAFKGEWVGDAAVIKRKLVLFQSICEAVNFAHQHGVIHRDLKPSNILVDNHACPHVLDFGLAKSAQLQEETADAPSITVAGEFMGTLAYASPEQTAGKPHEIDVRSDVYALGVILYELLTGAFPYTVTGPLAEIVDNIRHADAPPPSACWRNRVAGSALVRPARRPRQTTELDAIVLRALAKEKDRRYQSAGLLAQDVHHYLTGAPVDARGESSWYMISKLARRYRAQAIVAAAFVVLVIAFGITMTVMYSRTRAEAAKARQINIFLEDTLASVEPSRGGPDVTVREILDDAAQWIQIALSEQPEIAAAIHTTIGNSYRSLGYYETAEAHLRSALAIRNNLFGPQSIEVAESVNALAILKRKLGAHDEAKRLTRASLAVRRRLLGNLNTVVAMTLQNLGYVLFESGEYEEAETCFREALQIRRSLLGADHADVAMVVVNLARVAAARNDGDNARELYEQALAIRRRTLPVNHPDMSGILVEFGGFEFSQGRAAVAEPLVREALAIRQRALPVGHWKIADTQCALGRCLIAMGRFSETEALLLDGYPVLAARRGQRDDRTLEALRAIVRLYDAWGKPNDATTWRIKLDALDDAGHLETTN